MRARSRLKHAAAGLLGSLISRNNDVNGYWAPGLLYQDAGDAGHTMAINLLSGDSRPASPSASRMAANYLPFLRRALESQSLAWHTLTEATITFQFNVQITRKYFYFPCPGDPFLCAVTLRTSDQLCAAVSAYGRCYPTGAWFAARRG